MSNSPRKKYDTQLDTIDIESYKRIPVADPNVIGHNDPMEPRQILALALLLFVVALFTTGVVWMASGNRTGAVITGLIVLLFSVGMSLTLISGDMAVLFDTWMRTRVQMRWARVEEKRIDGVVDIAEFDHDVRIKSIEMANEMADIREDMGRLRFQYEQLTTKRLESSSQLAISTDRLEAHEAMEAWVRTLYTDPSVLYPSGLIKIKMPWNDAWSLKPWKAYATKRLQQGPLEKHGNNFKLRYPDDEREAIKSLGDRNGLL